MIWNVSNIQIQIRLTFGKVNEYAFKHKKKLTVKNYLLKYTIKMAKDQSKKYILMYRAVLNLTKNIYLYKCT